MSSIKRMMRGRVHQGGRGQRRSERRSAASGERSIGGGRRKRRKVHGLLDEACDNWIESGRKLAGLKGVKECESGGVGFGEWLWLRSGGG
jgi:hypothetical protein